MSKALMKAASQRNSTQTSLLGALRDGGPLVWLSCLILGFGNLMAGQIIKGLLLMMIEVAFVVFLLLPEGGIYYLKMLPSLGWLPMEEVYDEQLGIYKYVAGHNSQLILLYGVGTVFVIVGFLLLWRFSVCSGYKALHLRRAGKKPNSFLDDLKDLTDNNCHKLLMSLPTLCLVVFTILPIVYMMCMAFTNYSKEGDHLVLFDWVGFQNFAALFNPNSSIGSQLGSVLGWTLIWAILATVSNFFLGTIVAMIINRKTVKLQGLWRTCLSMTIAIPQFVSLMVIRSMLQPEGIVNSMLLEAHWITEKLPFLTNATWARVLVLVINLWVGIPYTIMQVTGILQNIPSEQYEAAKIDGANVFQVFRKITLPYMLFVMTPYLITQFTGNINNFNVIYLLTRGEPVSVGNTAGATDLLVTWLYKLSVDQQKYNLGAVIGIFTFVALSVVSLVTYRSSGSYKNEEGFK